MVSHLLIGRDLPRCHRVRMKTRSILQILLLSAVWGVSFLMIRIAGNAFPPFWVALLRCALGAGLLWAVLQLGWPSAATAPLAALAGDRRPVQ